MNRCNHNVNARMISAKYYSQIIHYYLTFHIDVACCNIIVACCDYPLCLTIFVLDTVTLSNLLPLRNYVPYCTSTGYLFNWLRGTWLRGRIRGPQNKIKINIAQQQLLVYLLYNGHERKFNRKPTQLLVYLCYATDHETNENEWKLS